MADPRSPNDGTRVIPTNRSTPTDTAATRAIPSNTNTNPQTARTRQTSSRDLPRYFAMVGVEPNLQWPDAPVVDDEAHAARYHAVSSLGEGGLGEVFLAWDADLSRHVAYKRLKSEHRSDPVLVRAFIEEAIITGRLEHPHIVPVHDIGVSTTDGPFYTMKLLRGEPLSAILKRLRRGDPETEAAWPLAARIAVFVRVLRGIAHAHAQGVIHCDLKPSNILVGELGEVTIVDWGLALALGDNAAAQARSLMWSGSPGYMAPEQCLGAPIHELGPHTDIWALGANLYELISLCVPQGGESGRYAPPPDNEDKDWARTWQPVVPLSRRGLHEAPPELVAATMTALADSPRDRHPSVLVFLEAVNGWLEGRRAEERRDAERVTACALAGEAVRALAVERGMTDTLSTKRAVRAAVEALTPVLDDYHADTRGAASELYWAMVRALHAAATPLPPALVAVLHASLDRLAELGVPTVQGGDIDVWYAAMERLAESGLPRVRGLLDNIRTLRATELFATLDGHALRSVAEALEPVALAPGQRIFGEGDVGDALYVVADGNISIDAAGRHLARLNGPACFGEVALVPGPDGARMPRTASATAETAGHAWRLSADRFETLAMRHGAIALGVMRLLAARLRTATERELASRQR